MAIHLLRSVDSGDWNVIDSAGNLTAFRIRQQITGTFLLGHLTDDKLDSDLSLVAVFLTPEAALSALAEYVDELG